MENRFLLFLYLNNNSRGCLKLFAFSNNEKLISESALKTINRNDFKERRLSVFREGKDSEIIFCVILRVRVGRENVKFLLLFHFSPTFIFLS